jgi:hypothetical protein
LVINATTISSAKVPSQLKGRQVSLAVSANFQLLLSLLTI